MYIVPIIFKQQALLKEELIGYTYANFYHATTFGCRNIAFQIWWLPCNPLRCEWPKTFFGGDKILLPTKHILHIALQCLSFTMACLKSMLWTIYASYKVFVQSELGKCWLFSFIVSIHWFWLFIQSALLPRLQLSSLLLKSSLSYPEWWNLHSPPKRIAHTFKWS